MLHLTHVAISFQPQLEEAVVDDVVFSIIKKVIIIFLIIIGMIKEVAVAEKGRTARLLHDDLGGAVAAANDVDDVDATA